MIGRAWDRSTRAPLERPVRIPKISPNNDRGEPVGPRVGPEDEHHDRHRQVEAGVDQCPQDPVGRTPGGAGGRHRQGHQRGGDPGEHPGHQGRTGAAEQAC